MMGATKTELKSFAKRESLRLIHSENGLAKPALAGSTQILETREIIRYSIHLLLCLGIRPRECEKNGKKNITSHLLSSPSFSAHLDHSLTTRGPIPRSNPLSLSPRTIPNCQTIHKTTTFHR